MKSDGGGVVLERIPMPPSSNHQYRTFIRRGRVIHAKTAELVQFRKEFDFWALENARGLQVAKELCAGCAIEVEAFFGFKRERLYTKANQFKSLDTSNRIKSLHDALADALDTDDKSFFSLAAEKFVVGDSDEEQVIVRVSPFVPRSFVDIKNVVL